VKGCTTLTNPVNIRGRNCLGMVRKAEFRPGLGGRKRKEGLTKDGVGGVQAESCTKDLSAT